MKPLYNLLSAFKQTQVLTEHRRRVDWACFAVLMALGVLILVIIYLL